MAVLAGIIPSHAMIAKRIAGRAHGERQLFGIDRMAGVGQQGLVAFECESCLYMMSQILPPLKFAPQLLPPMAPMAAIARPGVCENGNRPMNQKLSPAAPSVASGKVPAPVRVRLKRRSAPMYIPLSASTTTTGRCVGT